MFSRATATVVTVLLFALAVEAAELGPRRLRNTSSAARNNADSVHAAIADEARTWVARNTVRHRTDLTFQELVGRYVPGAEDLAGGARINRQALTRPQASMISRFAEQMATAAQTLLNAQLGGAAGLEAYRALGLDPGNQRAGRILGYGMKDGVNMPQPAVVRRSQQLDLTRFGWFPEALAKQERDGFAPDLGMWQPTGVVDARHSSWGQRHALIYTHIQIQTSLSLSEVTTWAREVDDMVALMRAMFVKVPGYREPAWPLTVKIYRNGAEVRSGGDQPPQKAAYWNNVGVVDHSGVTRARASLKGAVQQILAYGFLEKAFPMQSPSMRRSGWMSDAFGRAMYFADSTTPNRLPFLEAARPSLVALLRELAINRDVVGRLRSMSFNQSQTTDLSMAGPLLLEVCTKDELAWEGMARFLALLAAHREKTGSFEELIGSSADATSALAEYTGTVVGGGPVAPPSQPGSRTRTLTIGAQFLKNLGLDYDLLAERLGANRARQTAFDVLDAFVKKLNAGRVGTTLRAVAGRTEWTLELAGSPPRVREVVADLVWQAGIRLPSTPPAPPPSPDGAPGGVQPPPPATTGSRIYDQSVVNMASRLLRGHAEYTPQVRDRVARGDEDGVAALVALSRSRNADTRSAAVLVLGKIGDAHPSVTPALMAALKDPDATVRGNAVQAFHGMGAHGTDAVPELTAILVNDRDPKVRQSAAKALEQKPTNDLKGVLPTLLLGLKDKDPEVRKAVIEVLERVGGAHPETQSSIRAALLTSGGSKNLLDDLLRRIGEK